jgi:hypothetical protein
MAITWHDDTDRKHAPQSAQTWGAFLIETITIILCLAVLFGALPLAVQSWGR